MTESTPINELEVIGYANRLTASMLPAIVAPIFRLKADPGQILLPPYAIHRGLVCDALLKNSDELTDLNEAGEVTIFAAPFDAHQDFELWIDAGNNHRYEPIPDAARALRAIATQHIEFAQVALIEARYDEAERLCRIALCADDRLLEPLAIMAAISRRKGDPGGERTMAKLSTGRATPLGFRLMVDGFAAQLPDQYAVEAEDLFARQPMLGMAALRAAA